MNTTMRDVIEQEVTVRAAKERVFRAITDPEQLVAWFPDKVEGKIAAGENPIFEFNGYGTHTINVVAIEPNDYFAYRWDPSGFVGDVLSRPNTLVEFWLEDVSGGTKVKVKESGFASLAADVASKKFEENSGGWPIILGLLRKMLDKE